MTFGNRKVLALVPARGGSKGIPRKNLRLFRGRSLVSHALQAALDSARVDQVFLSSDDEEILEVGRDMGVQSLKRETASGDTATASEVVTHFLKALPTSLVESDPFIVYLQPTSPMRTAAHIDGAFSEMEARGGEMVMSVVLLAKSPFKSFKISDTGRLESLFEESLSNSNRQTLPKTYYPNGAIYVFLASEFLRRGRFPSNGSVPFVMTEKESIDIDTEDDLKRAEEA